MQSRTICSVIIVAVVLFGTLTTAIPEVAFPFNSQVPTVARVAQPYEFQFAETTFDQDDNANLTYSLSNAPAWLSLNIATRTLYGTPGQGDTGPNTFTITAADGLGVANMDCTLVVTDVAAPQVVGNLSASLAAAGTLSGPQTILLPPSSAFAISFGKGVFHDDPGMIQAYYATLADHTPLPAWLQFEEGSLGFWGVTPAASADVQSFVVDLIASDVVGFSGAAATFKLTVSSKQFAFEPQQESVNVAVGTPFKYQSLLSQLYLDGEPIQRDQIQSASAQVPSWLTFDEETLDLAGTPSSSFRNQKVQISVTDVVGDVAVKNIYLHADNSSLFAEEIGNLTAAAGQLFTYTISQSIFSDPDLSVSVDIPQAASWLTFNSRALQLRGTPPTTTTPSLTAVTIVAVSSSLARSESQTFTIQVASTAAGGGDISSSSLTSSTPSNKSKPTAVGAPPEKSSGKSPRIGIIVGVVIGCLAILALLFAVLMLLCRRRRRGPSQIPDKLNISRPLADQSKCSSHGATNDVEKATTDVVQTCEVDSAPHLSLNMMPSSLSAAQHDMRMSIASSMGDGEVVVVADSNIPIWGGESRASHTPHHSYSAATELARRNSWHSAMLLAQPAASFPDKRASRMLPSLQSAHSDGLGIDLQGTVLHRPRRSSKINSRLSFSRNPSSNTSINTRGTSLSIRASHFPEPSSSRHRGSCSIPTVCLTRVDKRRSIRLVSRSDSSTADARPLAEKRQSFIRNRASSSIISPLFASSRRSSNLNETALDETSGLQLSQSLRRGRSTRGPSHSHGQRTTFLASSSLEPPARNLRRRLVSAGASVFAPNFPRAITPSPVREQPSPTLPSRSTATAAAAATATDDDDSDLYTTTTGTTATTTSSSSRTRSAHATRGPDADADAELAAQLALPRHARSWVLPGEASPTPPPSSGTRRARRRQADGVQRSSISISRSSSSRGERALSSSSSSASSSRGSSPVRINLRSTSVPVPVSVSVPVSALVPAPLAVATSRAGERQRQRQRQRQLQRAKEIGGGARDALSQLVSNDSLGSVMRRRRRAGDEPVGRAGAESAALDERESGMKGAVAEMQSAGGAAAAAEDEDPQWEWEEREDVISAKGGSGSGGGIVSGTGLGFGVGIANAENETPASTVSGRAFL
ncbi:hypothetical protein MBLNU459_g6072t1 [Dothideomycetes sp. NU459]